MASTGSAVRPEDVRQWGQQIDQVAHRIGARFARSETRDRVRAYLVGLLGPVQRKNAWQVAEQIGDADPYGLQYLMGRADWDPDAVRDDLRGYVVETLGDPDAVLVLDETGFLKKGTKSAGVARQYTGTAGRIENAQVGVFLAYASRYGTAFLDRALYLPEEWTDDPKRCEAAGVPEGVAFATKPRLAEAMLARAFAAGVPAAWVTGDEVYGSDGRLRRWLEGQRRPYVLAVRANQYAWAGFRQSTVAALAKALPKRAWHKITIAAGSKGPRRYAWAWLPINSDLGPRWRRWLLVRRSLDDPEELAYYIAAGPRRTTLTRLARTAGTRWAVEGAFESAKQEVGLGHYEVRSWTGWYRHVTLSLLAQAVLAAVRRLADGPPKKSRPASRS
jgi:SRSO17 transposase